MQKIEFLQAVDGHAVGSIATVENNKAHSYIDKGFAKLSTGTYLNRMLTSEPPVQRVEIVEAPEPPQDDPS